MRYGVLQMPNLPDLCRAKLKACLTLLNPSWELSIANPELDQVESSGFGV